MLDIGLVHFLLVGAVMFAIGIAIVITKRNGVAVLMGLEVVIAASSINFKSCSMQAMDSRQITKELRDIIETPIGTR